MAKRKENKKAYAIYKKNELVDCHFIKGVAVSQVDEVYGDGLFSKPWENDAKGDYRIIECECEYDRIYVVDSLRIHSDTSPTIFPSMEALADFIKERGFKVRRKGTRGKRFAITTNMGIIKGRTMNVK